MQDISGKTAIITGGGTGVGKAIATTLVKAGVNVMISGRRKEPLKDTDQILTHLKGGNAACTRVVKNTLDTFGQLDFLINNAGLGVGSLVADTTESDWDMVMDTNLKGAFFMMQSVLPTMMAQKSGKILNIASQAAKRGYAQAGVYCASKFGLIGLADALQEEVYEHNILVHSLCPALIQTPDTKSDKERKADILQVENIADLALFIMQQPSTVKLDDIGLYARPTGRTRT